MLYHIGLRRARLISQDPRGFEGTYGRATLAASGLILILGLIYAAALLFYLFSWAFIGPAGIEQRLPWGHNDHSFDQITSLEMIPGGMRSDKLVKNGPWYSVEFADNSRSFTFGDDNEGCSEAELSAMAKFIAQRSGKLWRVRADARPR